MSLDPHSETINLRDSFLQPGPNESGAEARERETYWRMYDSLLPHRYRIRPARLEISIDGGVPLEAPVAGGIVTALQRATAKLVESRLQRGANVTIASAGAKQRALLQLVSASGRQLVLDMVQPPPAVGQLMQPTATTQAELGLIDLCETLPSAATLADRAVHNLLGANLTVRSAVRDLVDSPILDRTVTLRLESTRGEAIIGLLSPDQTRFLRKELVVDPAEEVRRDSIVGYLDGARVLRRVFYIETKTGTVEGAIEPELVSAVQSMTGRVIKAGVDVRRRKGRRPLYNLVSIEEGPVGPVYDYIARRA